MRLPGIKPRPVITCKVGPRFEVNNYTTSRDVFSRLRHFSLFVGILFVVVSCSVMIEPEQIICLPIQKKNISW